ncbi:MAG: phosphotransferase [Bryobacterales bacterium]
MARSRGAEQESSSSTSPAATQPHLPASHWRTRIRPAPSAARPRAAQSARHGEFRVLDRSGCFACARCLSAVREEPVVAGHAHLYLMERRHGALRREASLIGARKRTSKRSPAPSFDTLALTYAVDIERHDPRPWPPRRLSRTPSARLSRRWEGSRTTDLPVMDRLSAWLVANLPASLPATLVHNDYKLDNVMLDKPTQGAARHRSARLEMSLVGDPLVDLGIVLATGPEAGAEQNGGATPSVRSPPSLAAFASRPARPLPSASPRLHEHRLTRSSASSSSPWSCSRSTTAFTSGRPATSASATSTSAWQVCRGGAAGHGIGVSAIYLFRQRAGRP